MQTKIAIIPARGGSKRIPRKNIKTFAGRPMIAWAIDTALRSALFDRVVVSTDDEEVAGIAREHGAEVPFMRPAELANDHTATRPVIHHAIEALERDGPPVDIGCCIYPASPFVTPEDLKQGYEKITQDGATFAFAACGYPHPIQRAFRLLETGGVEMREPEHRLTRSQDLVEYYRDAGQFYWGTRAGFFSETPFYSDIGRLVLLPAERAIDIDTFDDWRRAELAHRILFPS